MMEREHIDGEIARLQKRAAGYAQKLADKRVHHTYRAGGYVMHLSRTRKAIEKLERERAKVQAESVKLSPEGTDAMNRNQRAARMSAAVIQAAPGEWWKVCGQIKTSSKIFNSGSAITRDQVGEAHWQALVDAKRIKSMPAHIKPTCVARDLPTPTPVRPPNPAVETVIVGGDVEASAAQTLKLMTEKCSALAPWETPQRVETWAKDLIAHDHAASDVAARAECSRQARVRRERGVRSL